MHERLVNYLRDNREHIVEHWLTETDVPPAPGSATAGDFDADGPRGVVPLAFFEDAVDGVIEIIRTGHAPETDNATHTHLDDFLGFTCSCARRRPGGRVCIELHDAGLEAFMAVFAEEWDGCHEFNALDRECCHDLVNHALSGLFAREIELCRHKLFRQDCPFAAENAMRRRIT